MESTYTTKQGDVWDKIAYEVYLSLIHISEPTRRS